MIDKPKVKEPEMAKDEPPAFLNRNQEAMRAVDAENSVSQQLTDELNSILDKPLDPITIQGDKVYHGIIPPKKPTPTQSPDKGSIDPAAKTADEAPKLQPAYNLVPPTPGKGAYADGNPKTAFGQVKPGTFYSPAIPTYLMGLVHLQGALKYGPFNWRDDPISASTYIEAIERHLKLYKKVRIVHLIPLWNTLHIL